MLAPRTTVLLTCSAAFVACLPSVSSAAERAVLKADATVWSSSGDDRIAAASVREGQAVVVYDQRDGLAAIKPPEGTTSMVIAAAIQLDANGATVKHSTHSWVCDESGQRVAPATELRPGETVQVLGRVEETDGSVWWRIAPPSGEFRWVRLQDLRFDDTRSADSSRSEGLQPLASAIPLTAIEEPSEELTPIDHEAPAAKQSNAAENVGFATRLSAIELALSTIVATPAESWRLGPLRAEANSLALQAETNADRRLADDLIRRIDRFATISDRTQASYRVAPPVKQTRAFQSTSPQQRANGSGYDAVGRLRPVVSKNADAPRYAVVGRDGQSLTLVTPTDGVDLQPLIGKQVGLNGAKGFIPRYGKPHLTAERVRVLR